MPREIITDAFEVAGMVAIAAGIGAGLAAVLGWFALAVSGALLISFSVGIMFLPSHSSDDTGDSG